MFQNYRRKKIAALRRKLRADLKSSLEYKHSEERKKANMEAMSELRTKIAIGVSEIVSLVGTYYPDHHSDIRNIHGRIDDIITYTANAAYSGPTTIGTLINNLLWMATVIPENRNEKIQNVVGLLVQYQYNRWGVV